jgi:hypothetical protein
VKGLVSRASGVRLEERESYMGRGTEGYKARMYAFSALHQLPGYTAVALAKL